MRKSDDINPWEMTRDEWSAHFQKQRAIEEASPEFRARRSQIRLIACFIAQMLYPRNLCHFDLEFRKGRIVRTPPSGEPIRKREYPWNAGEQLVLALERYFYVYRKSQILTRDEETQLLNDASPGMAAIILDSCETAKWPFKLGAALYLHQQMAVRHKDSEPSQGKALWLVTKAPVSPIKREGNIHLRPDGGDPSKIGDQWKHYYSVAHYWAAFVVWAKSPLNYPTDRFALIDFVASVNPNEFLKNAAAFKKFRADQPISASKANPFIKQGLDEEDSTLDDVVPTDPLLIPDPLYDYQWAALKDYKTRPRPNRATRSQLVADS